MESVQDRYTKQFTALDTCFGTHHLQFAEDADNTLVFSNPGGQEVGFLNTRQYDQTGDAIASQGWCRRIPSSSTTSARIS